MPSHVRDAFRRGLVDSSTIALGYIPVAISFGLAAAHQGISPFVTVLISLLVYAGASQFVLLSMLASGANGLSVLLVVVVMNLRHLFYGPSVLTLMPHRPRSLSVYLLGAGLTDEVFAAASGKLSSIPEAMREWWYCGLQLGAYASWVGGTAVGAYLAQDLLADSQLISKTLGFVLPALFFALLLEIRHAVSPGVMCTAALVACGTVFVLPAYAGIIVAMLAGGLYALRRA